MDRINSYLDRIELDTLHAIHAPLEMFDRVIPRLIPDMRVLSTSSEHVLHIVVINPIQYVLQELPSKSHSNYRLKVKSQGSTFVMTDLIGSAWNPSAESGSDFHCRTIWSSPHCNHFTQWMDTSAIIRPQLPTYREEIFAAGVVAETAHKSCMSCNLCNGSPCGKIPHHHLRIYIPD